MELRPCGHLIDRAGKRFHARQSGDSGPAQALRDRGGQRQGPIRKRLHQLPFLLFFTTSFAHFWFACGPNPGRRHALSSVPHIFPWKVMFSCRPCKTASFRIIAFPLVVTSHCKLHWQLRNPLQFYSKFWVLLWLWKIHSLGCHSNDPDFIDIGISCIAAIFSILFSARLSRRISRSSNTVSFFHLPVLMSSKSLLRVLHSPAHILS